MGPGMCLGPGKFLPSDCRLLTQYMKPGDWTRFVLRLLLSTNSLNLEGHHFRGLYFLTLIAQTSLSLCLGSSQQNLRQKFRVCGLPKKCFLRGLGAGPGRRSCRAPAGTSLYSDPQHRYGPMVGAGGPAFWGGGRTGFHSNLQHRDGPVLGRRASFLWWWARREGISKVRQLLYDMAGNLSSNGVSRRC